MLARSRGLSRTWLGKQATAGLSNLRWFNRSAVTGVKNLQLPPRAPLDESEIEESFLKGTGPGGQKINKTSSAVQLQHVPSGIVVKCQATRSRSQNRKMARQMLVDKLEEAEKGDESRSAIKVQIKHQKSASKKKKSRRKYRALEEQKKYEGMGSDNSDVATAHDLDEGEAQVETGAEIIEKSQVRSEEELASSESREIPTGKQEREPRSKRSRESRVPGGAS